MPTQLRISELPACNLLRGRFCKNFALLAALNGVRGEKPAASSFADAQYGFAFELAWWGKYADAH